MLYDIYEDMSEKKKKQAVSSLYCKVSSCENSFITLYAARQMLAIRYSQTVYWYTTS